MKRTGFFSAGLRKTGNRRVESSLKIRNIRRAAGIAACPTRIYRAVFRGIERNCDTRGNNPLPVPENYALYHAVRP